ncbi:glycosyltransferase [Pontibacterium granulatum]|uniref:glycosyltransferase n=1 Tax=Pontibacterium granulatum TaxID=2036029 RepID=UPI00249BEEFA|nr:glycosyltransferase [Pontibacterium granulatum]MDI3325738.1 glycosyltransferase [Pontibacterium granulatum]
MAAWIVFAISLLGIGVLFGGYPFILFLQRKQNGTGAVVELPDAELPSLSVLVAVRNGEGLIEKKVRNALDLDYPEDRLEVVVVSDGSTDMTGEILERIDDKRFKFYLLQEHKGKQEALNVGMSHCRGDVVLFTDADAVLERDAARQLVKHFSDQNVGGVGGQRLILDQHGKMKGAQKSYIKADSQVKILESKSGSTTSNDGKIYAIRRELFQGVAEAVTDDLYVCLTVLRQGKRFKFEPEAKAYIATPSRSSGHEMSRRRRIVNRSLRGIWLNREVLNPNRTSCQIAAGLFINKVMRRMLPFFLLLLIASTAILAVDNPPLLLFLGLQVVFIVMAVTHPLLERLPFKVSIISKVASLAFYFSLGNMGAFMGVIDFFSGQRPVRWDPKKTG